VLKVEQGASKAIAKGRVLRECRRLMRAEDVWVLGTHEMSMRERGLHRVLHRCAVPGRRGPCALRNLSAKIHM